MLRESSGESLTHADSREAIGVAVASQVAAVARTSDKLDIFIIGKEGGVWTAAWDKSGGWNAWREGAVFRAPSKLDIFIVGEDSGVWSAAWDRDVAGGDWQGWWPVPN